MKGDYRQAGSRSTQGLPLGQGQQRTSEYKLTRAGSCRNKTASRRYYTTGTSGSGLRGIQMTLREGGGQGGNKSQVLYMSFCYKLHELQDVSIY